MSPRSAVFTVILTLATTDAFARSGGPPADRVKLCRTAAGACSNCHASTTPPSALTVTMTMGGQAVLPTPSPTLSYVPDQVYDFVLQATEGNPSRCSHPAGTLSCGRPVLADQCAIGFQLAAVVATSCAGSPQQAGCLLPTGAPATTQVVCGPGQNLTCGSATCTGANGLQYIEHVCATAADATALASNQWTFQWQAPPAGTGAVALFLAVNSADADGGNTNDVPWFSADQPGLNLVIQEGSVAAACDLRTDSAVTLGPPLDKQADLFPDTTCSPDGWPGMIEIGGFSSSPSALVGPWDSGDPIEVWMVGGQGTNCTSCAGTLYLIKDRSAGQLLVSLQ